ncbi:GntR family transcriptional regulator [Cupriavidus consociatus]|uniref:GntR family transcriptional regulator n=1 Tax=Cupriavidus consociatus TaxID=2821357 RepID=UPI001AE2B5B3|nr:MULTISPECIES: GntR family transcriptional regulator [unclassified Cupriavidus]MBP0621478.1 GntR family transcriptional regulator [Cupriavidus sp. LEh25]MDK2658151.1 GntR family transcriptional regulator [Cupriavidus sp. LEh21]
MPEEKKSLSDTIRAAIEQEILSGKLPSGTQLEEQQLLARFGVSRTPVREALIQLESAGLVDLVPRQGAIVSSITLREYVAMNEILVQLEALAARLAARRITPAQRSAMQEALAACRAAAGQADSQRYRETNDAFHDVIYEACCNDILSRQIRTMRARMRGMRDLRFEKPARILASLEEHEAVMAAIERGSEEEAAAAMVRHIATGGDVYADMIASMPGDEAGSKRARR